MTMNIEFFTSILSLSALEIILGIDNVVFIALVVAHLPTKQAQSARYIGITLALLLRIAFLIGVLWIMSLEKPWFTLFAKPFSIKDVLMLGGGLFLIAKATSSIHNQITGDEEQNLKEYKGGFFLTVLQIIFIDLIFSFDSIMTAVGIVKNITVIIIAMVIAMIIMLGASGVIANFIARYSTLKMLALSFIMVIGLFLMAEGFGLHIPKGYIYFGMFFSLSVETLNMIARKKNKGS